MDLYKDTAAEGLAEVLLERRQALNLTQRDLEANCGVSRNTITKFERGVTDPQFGTIIRLLRGLDWSLADLHRALARRNGWGDVEHVGEVEKAVADLVQQIAERILLEKMRSADG